MRRMKYGIDFVSVQMEAMSLDYEQGREAFANACIDVMTEFVALDLKEGAESDEPLKQYLICILGTVESSVVYGSFHVCEQATPGWLTAAIEKARAFLKKERPNDDVRRMKPIFGTERPTAAVLIIGDRDGEFVVRFGWNRLITERTAMSQMRAMFEEEHSERSKIN